MNEMTKVCLWQASLLNLITITFYGTALFWNIAREQLASPITLFTQIVNKANVTRKTRMKNGQYTITIATDNNMS